MNRFAKVFFAVASIAGFSYRTYGSYTTFSIDTTRHYRMTLIDVLKKNADRWMRISGVTGTGEGISGGKTCIVVFVVHKSEAIKRKIPKEAGGYKVVLEETGKLNAR
jgi:hypothetical protein